MKIKDILKEESGWLGNPSIPPFDPNHSKIVGVFDGYDIWLSKEIPNNDTYGIKDNDGNIMSVCRINSTGKDNIRGFKEIWTRTDKRGQGIATILMLFILRKIGLKLWIQKTEIVSDDSRGMIWKGLKDNRFKSYTLDGTLLNIKDVWAMFNTWGETDDELILSEKLLNIELFSDKKIDSNSEWYIIRNTNHNLD